MKCQKLKIFERLRNQRFQRKAQGISINTIIIAAIALIVLIILIAVFTGRIGLWGKDMDTAQQGQVCNGIPRMSTCNEGETQVIGSFKKCTGTYQPSSTKRADGCLFTGELCCE